MRLPAFLRRRPAAAPTPGPWQTVGLLLEGDVIGPEHGTWHRLHGRRVLERVEGIEDDATVLVLSGRADSEAQREPLLHVQVLVTDSWDEDQEDYGRTAEGLIAVDHLVEAMAAAGVLPASAEADKLARVFDAIRGVRASLDDDYPGGGMDECLEHVDMALQDVERMEGGS